MAVATSILCSERKRGRGNLRHAVRNLEAEEVREPVAEQRIRRVILTLGAKVPASRSDGWSTCRLQSEKRGFDGAGDAFIGSFEPSRRGPAGAGSREARNLYAALSTTGVGTQNRSATGRGRRRVSAECSAKSKS